VWWRWFAAFLTWVPLWLAIPLWVLAMAGLWLGLLLLLFVPSLWRLCRFLIRGFWKALLKMVFLGWQFGYLLAEFPGLARWLLSSPVSDTYLGLECTVNISDGDREAAQRGIGWSSAEGIALASACCVVGPTQRFRPRGVYTRRLQSALGATRGGVAAFFRRRWTPDLPSERRSPILNTLLALRDNETKILGLGSFQTKDAGEGDFVLVENRRGDREVIVPTLAGVLSRYVTLRARDSKTFVGVRSRASDWFKRVEAPSWAVQLCLPGAVVAAMTISGFEQSAMGRLSAMGVSPLEVG